MRDDIKDFIEQTEAGETIIYLPSGFFSISESAQRIYGHMKKRDLAFHRGGRVHEVVVDADGRLRLDVLSPEAMRSRIEKLGRTMAHFKNQKGEWSVTDKRPATEDCKALLVTTEARTILQPISNVYSSPVLVLDNGQPVTIPKGYNRAAGGAFVCDGDAAPVVEVTEAARALGDLLCDFRYVSECDRTRNLSTILSPALRFGGFIPGNCPSHTNEADQSQTGKGYNLEIIAAIYGERPALVTMKSGGVGGFDEALSQRLIDGRPFVQFDNLRGKLDSQYLEAVLTAPGEVGCRVPHRGEVYIDPRRFFFTATSNGFEATTDLANRSCIIRLRKQPEGYQFKRWAEGGLAEHIRANHIFYLGCVHSIIRAWWAKGAPKSDTCGHDFRAWAQTVEGIIRFAWPDAAPLLEGHHTAQVRTSNPALAFLRAVCLALEADDRTNSLLSASAIAEVCAEAGIEIPGLRDAANEESAKKQVGLLLSRCMKGGDKLVLDEFEVTRQTEERDRDDGRGKFTLKKYEVRRAGIQSPDPIQPRTQGVPL